MKNILLAISGLTPQIVTETIFAIYKKYDIVIDELFIVTTKRGLEVLKGKDKSSKTPKTAFDSQLKKLAKHINIKTPKFNIEKNVIVASEENLEVYDIKTDKHNILFPNKVAELIAKLTEKQDNIIHASLSGGRKSMSAHLALVMSLFARSRDKLYHVITEEKFEFKNFFPQSKEEEKALTIAEVPFVRLRSLNAPLLKDAKSYSDLVEKTQKRLSFITDNAHLIVDLLTKKIAYKENSVELTPMEISIYFQFCDAKISGKGNYGISEINDKKFAEKTKAIMEEYYNQYYDKSNKLHWTNNGLDEAIFRSYRSKINSKLKILFTDEEFNEFKISSQKVWGATSYFILAPKEKIKIIY